MNSKSNLPKKMIPCRWCHEPIMNYDDICKHCNEYQSDLDQHKYGKELLNDSTLSITDWVIIFLFQLIGFGLGGIHLANGEKTRGFKVIIYSLILAFINITTAIVNYGIFRYFSKLINMN